MWEKIRITHQLAKILSFVMLCNTMEKRDKRGEGVRESLEGTTKLRV